jgi:hypothetical protein
MKWNPIWNTQPKNWHVYKYRADGTAYCPKCGKELTHLARVGKGNDLGRDYAQVQTLPVGECDNSNIE